MQCNKSRVDLPGDEHDNQYSIHLRRVEFEAGLRRTLGTVISMFSVRLRLCLVRTLQHRDLRVRCQPWPEITPRTRVYVRVL